MEVYLSMHHYEVNFDGLVGPTHNYAGLSYGNVASLSNAKSTSNPKAAAKQGLAKMKALHDMGMVQGVLAPHERPDIDTLRRFGFLVQMRKFCSLRLRKRRRSIKRFVLLRVCGLQTLQRCHLVRIPPMAKSILPQQI